MNERIDPVNLFDEAARYNPNKDPGSEILAGILWSCRMLAAYGASDEQKIADTCQTRLASDVTPEAAETIEVHIQKMTEVHADIEATFADNSFSDDEVDRWLHESTGG